VSSREFNAAAPVVARHAASVLLLREAGGDIEVLLTRRHENMAFMGGMWVFPGGTLCPADESTEALRLIPDAARSRCPRMHDPEGNVLPDTTCMALAIAAIRETFEESGVLLAMTTDGQHCDQQRLARLRQRRSGIVSQPQLFATSLQEEHLLLDMSALVYWSHWITPSSMPKRFDTRFFLARLPQDQVAAVDASEAIEMEWMTPAAVIAAANDGTMKVSRPTLYNLLELDASVRQHLSLNTILHAEARRDVVPVMPKIIGGEARMIIMPWDHEYHALAGVGISRHVEYPQRLRALASRISER
jgi:8-oxo-dGTP pyrophosphatase MutT (NUDIX family)